MIERGLARALIRSLTRGTAIRQGVRHIHVGQEKWLKAQDELLDEVGEDGHSDTKFVRGAYGAGKSHFLAVIQDRARSRGWATSHVECKLDGVQIDRFETLYPKITARLLMPGLSADHFDAAHPVRGPIQLLLDQWSAKMLNSVGIHADAIRRPVDADNRLYHQLYKGLLSSNFPSDFTKAMAVYVRAALANDFDIMMRICSWLGGVDEKISVPEKYLQKPDMSKPSTAHRTVDLRPIGRGTAREVLRGFLWLIKESGAKGLVLCIDEIEELRHLPQRRRRDQALQMLREFVDEAGGDGGCRYLCMYLAATPEMFEGQDYFPRYDALQTRIQAVGPEINWRAPVVDLDRTPLREDEMIDVAERIRRVHTAAYDDAPKSIDENAINRFVSAVFKSRFRIAKPRLLARVLVDELERARHQGGDYVPPINIEAKLADTVRKIQEEAEN
jgi:hypothetical protein